MKNLVQPFLLLLTLLISLNSFSNEREKILKIYNWADYIDEELLAQFPSWYKEQTGEEVKIVYQVFDMNEVMYTKIALGQEDFDLACPTQAVMQRMLHNDLLIPVNKDFKSTPNYLSNLSPFIIQRLGEYSIKGKNAVDYAVPYMWGVSGILYNTEKIPAEKVQSWGCFWDPANKGKMLMKDSYWDAYATAAVYGYRKEIASGKRNVYGVINDHTDDDIALVEEQLKLLKPNIAGWEADFGKDMMTKGEIWFCYAWNGDAVWAIDEANLMGVPLKFVVPEEGSNIWFDCWVIPKYAQNTKAAAYFLNYLCMPEIALKNMEVSGYCSAVATPEILESVSGSAYTEPLDLSYFFGEGHDSLFVNPVQYPDKKVVERCAIINDYLDKNDQVLAMWSRAKGDNLASGMIALIAGAALLLLTWVFYARFRKKQTRKRKSKK